MLFTERHPEFPHATVGVYLHMPPGFPDNPEHNRTYGTCPDGRTLAEPADDDVIDAEVVDWPDVDARSPLYRQPTTPDEPDIVDAEIVDCDCDSGCQHPAVCGLVADRWPPDDTGTTMRPDERHNQLIRQAVDMDIAARQARVRVVPQGTECWWRLYSHSPSPLRDYQDHGVQWVIADDPQHLRMGLVDVDGPFELTALDCRINEQRELAAAGAQHDSDTPTVESLDLLVQYPPELPGKPRNWQQMTKAGELHHPGGDRANWRYDWLYGEPRPINLEDGDELWPEGTEMQTAQQINPERDRLMSLEEYRERKRRRLDG
jgi:hypothetical protein